MTLEELSNIELLQLFVNVLAEQDNDYALEIQEEIFSRMEGEGA